MGSFSLEEDRGARHSVSVCSIASSCPSCPSRRTLSLIDQAGLERQDRNLPHKMSLLNKVTIVACLMLGAITILAMAYLLNNKDANQTLLGSTSSSIELWDGIAHYSAICAPSLLGIIGLARVGHSIFIED